MVRKEASLRAIGLMIVLMVHDGLSLLQMANRQQGRQLASAAGETTQRVLSLYAQAASPSESWRRSFKECIALALEGNFDVLGRI